MKTNRFGETLSQYREQVVQDMMADYRMTRKEAVERLGSQILVNDFEDDLPASAVADGLCFDMNLDHESTADELHEAPTYETWYCPNGHNVFTSDSYSRSEPPECGSCGASMSTNSDSYYDVIGEIESAGIARFESAHQD